MNLPSFSRYLAGCALLLGAAARPALADDAVVQWDYARADAHGSGCHAGDTAFITAGNELTIIFSGLGVSLDGAGAHAANKDCVVTVPVHLAQPAHGGWHIRALAESLLYGYIRSGGADGSVDFASHLFGLSTGKLSAAIPGAGQDPDEEPYLELAATTVLPRHGSPCNQGHQHGNYVGQIKIAAHRGGDADTIAIEISGQDIRLNLAPQLEADDCAR